jgi:arsenite-transporting ATPase
VRVLLFTGKGGVGKTTIAAATALRCAEAGARTLVLSTDPAHSLADCLDVDLGSQPTPVPSAPGAPRAPGTNALFGQQLDAQERMEESWGDIKAYLTEVFDWAGVDAVQAEELALLPGLDELFALSDIKALADSGDWDVIVVDCAPTAETIRLLSLPDVLAWYMDRIFPVSRRVNRIVAPVLSRVSTLPVAGDDVFGATHRFYARLDGVKALLADRGRSSVRLVVNPEQVVIAEARRTYTYLSLFGYRVDAVIANRLLPDAVDDPWFEHWKVAQRRHLEVIEESFRPLPVLQAALARDEPVGVDRLRELAAGLYGERDPAAVLHDAEPMSITRRGDRHVLELALPFVERDELEVGRHGDELLVRVGPYRRSITLPDTLRSKAVHAASLRAGRLTVTFVAGAGVPPASSPPARRATSASVGEPES